MSTVFDVLVVGGGPAGSSAALQLAQLGYRVAVAEREQFPRRHVGESQTPPTMSLLQSLGLYEQIRPFTLTCGPPQIEWAGTYSRDQQSEQDYGFQIDRGRFDAALLAAAQVAGASILQPAHVTKIQRLSDSDWRVRILIHGEQKYVRCRFVIDASGRRSILKGARPIRYGPKTIAISAWWKDTTIQAAETRVEAGTDCWYWGAMLPDGTFNATVFVNGSGFRSTNGHPHIYEELLEKSRMLRECVKGTKAGPMRVGDATCISRDPCCESNWFKVGEAGFAMDPLSSQGVQTAISSGLRAAIAINTIEKRPNDSDLAVRFVNQRNQSAVRRHVATCREMYYRQWNNTPTEFWRQRSVGYQPENPGVLPGLPHASERIHVHENVRFIPTGEIINHLIRPALAVHAPRLKEPVTKMAGVEIAPLLQCLNRPHALADLIRIWSTHMKQKDVATVLECCWNYELIRAERPRSPSPVATS